MKEEYFDERQFKQKHRCAYRYGNGRDHSYVCEYPGHYCKYLDSCIDHYKGITFKHIQKTFKDFPIGGYPVKQTRI
jgi:hypothetical protein